MTKCDFNEVAKQRILFLLRMRPTFISGLNVEIYIENIEVSVVRQRTFVEPGLVNRDISFLSGGFSSMVRNKWRAPH